MRLKRLELVGFKSFANKITLEFDQGITAIVGPNGSGKSNISDAIRWVLGEQSVKSLRGVRLEDVIFAGSDGKRPLGMAEVQLTLDNTDGAFPIDYNEITVARRVYRSGDSEFFINRNLCRLKDIQNLFTDTGLGKEGYAIIGQGQIDAVLNANPYERRLLLEETAGIVKYRQRKENAQRKMKQTEYDMVRISDILAELKQQLIPLEAEAQKARLYQKLAKELEDVELDLMSLNLNKLSAKQQILNKTIAELQEKKENVLAQYNLFDDEIIKDQKQLSAIEHQIDEQQKEIHFLNEQINQKIQTIGVLETKLNYNQEQQIAKKGQLEKEDKLRHKFSYELVELEKEFNKQEEKCDFAQAELIKYQNDLQKTQTLFQETRQHLESSKNEFIEFVRHLAESRNFSRNYEQQKLALKQQIQYAQTENEQLGDNLAKIDATILAQRQVARKLQETQSQNLVKLNQLMLKQEKAKDRLETIEQEFTQQNHRLQQLSSRLKALQDLEENYDGFSYSVRTLMQQPIPGVKILGTVASVISVPKGFEVAIETALGNGLQNMITTNEQDAKLAIQWLKKNRAGRGTFLPLNRMKSSTFPAGYAKYWKIDKCLGPAIDLIEFDKIFLPAISSLLGRIIITEDLDTALILQRTIPSFNRIVTKAGEIIMPSGSLTGGSLNQRTSGFLLRKNEISSLQEEQVKLNQIIDKVLVEKHQAQGLLAKVGLEIEQTQGLKLETKYEIQQIESELAKLEAENKNLNQLFQAKAKQLSDYEHTAKELEEQSAVAAETIVDLENREEINRSQIAKLEIEVSEFENQITLSNDEITQMRINLTQYLSEKQLLTREILSTRTQISKVGTTIKKLTQEKNQLEQQYLSMQLELDSGQKQQESLKLERNRVLEHCNANKETKITLQAGINENSASLKVLQKTLNTTDNQIYNKRLELDGIQLELRRIEEDLLERQLEANQVQQREVLESITNLKESAKDLKEKIRQLGIVNLGSLHDYETVKERAFFLTAQLEDLESAKATLTKLIAKIDNVSVQRLINTVQDLKKEFQLMFAKLFNGGTATIKLTDEENVLESGVDIIAQPPGKTRQHLSLLSGGERALTAIALWFAIRRIKPTPFCVLDEIDSALDEANLERFAKQMREISQSMQLLIITHRQVTMGAADGLYGITMGEDGVSQLVSVKLA